MAHYVCTGGCGGGSKTPGTCNNQECMKYHQPLAVCHCSDGSHKEAYEHPNVAIDEGDAEIII